jgi:UDP-N-acetylmuramate--alanine ligase
MRGVAAVLQRWGARVSGSDLAEFAELGRLVAGGAVVRIGHRAEQVPSDADLVVVTAAIPDENAELCQARRLGLPVMTYAELVGLLMSQRVGVAVAGTHGKSTTAALAAYIFRQAGLDPSFIVGAESSQLGGGSGVGDGSHFIVESCEYARSFWHQHPRTAAILNIEREHLDCYADLAEIVSAFGAFAGQVDTDGVIIARHDDAAVSAATAGAEAAVETFGLEPGADWRATELRVRRGQYSFAVEYHGERLLNAAPLLAGVHNVLNALAATALAWHGGAEPEAIAEALRTFEGIGRRMTLRGTAGGVTVIDDYAHHPTEIAATLRAVRERHEPRRTWVVFQPHQHSRTRMLMDEFATCFADADVVVVPDVYAAREAREAQGESGGSPELVQRLRSGGVEARYLPTLNEATAHVKEATCPGDLVVTMGAGDVWKVADALVERV